MFEFEFPTGTRAAAGNEPVTWSALFAWERVTRTKHARPVAAMNFIAKQGTRTRRCGRARNEASGNFLQVVRFGNRPCRLGLTQRRATVPAGVASSATATCKLPWRNTGSPLAVSPSCPGGQEARTPLAGERGAADHSWQRA
jgi:hypothetical protein